MKSEGIEVKCPDCELIQTTTSGKFEISVPIADLSTGSSAAARLKCSVNKDVHEIELARWRDEDPYCNANPELKKRLQRVLVKLANQRVCGNQNICPVDIVELVERIARG